MRIIFADDATEDLRSIRAWITKNSPRAAREMVQKILDRISSLELPELIYIGRPGLEPGTRELIVSPYIVVYEVHEEIDEIVVLAIAHGARKRKPRDD